MRKVERGDGSNGLTALKGQKRVPVPATAPPLRRGKSKRMNRGTMESPPRHQPATIGAREFGQNPRRVAGGEALPAMAGRAEDESASAFFFVYFSRANCVIHKIMYFYAK